MINDWLWQDFETTGSTNDDAKQKSAEVVGEKFVITAKEQTNGRGRRGRSWIGLEGNLFMSLGLEVELKDLSRIIFVVGLSLLEAIRFFDDDLDVKLKWPNDVLVNERKVSGVLLEKGEGNYLIIGIGVNITSAPQIKNLLYPAISLKDCGIEVDRLEFLRCYLDFFDKNLHKWQTEGFGCIRNAWLKNAKALGQEICVQTEKELKSGVFKGVDEDGILLLETKQGMEKIYAGDVFYKELK